MEKDTVNMTIQHEIRLRIRVRNKSGGKDDKSETTDMDEKGWMINQQGAPKTLMPSSSVISNYVYTLE